MTFLSFDRRSFAPFAFSPVAFAIQELVEEIEQGWDTSQGAAPRSPRVTPRAEAESNLLEVELLRQRQMITRQNELVVRLITAAVTQGML